MLPQQSRRLERVDKLDSEKRHIRNDIVYSAFSVCLTVFVLNSMRQTSHLVMNGGLTAHSKGQKDATKI